MIFICCLSTDITPAFAGNARTQQVGMGWRGAGWGGALGWEGCEDSLFQACATFAPLQEATASAGAST